MTAQPRRLANVLHVTLLMARGVRVVTPQPVSRATAPRARISRATARSTCTGAPRPTWARACPAIDRYRGWTEECFRAWAASAVPRPRIAPRGTAPRLPRRAVAVSTSMGARVVLVQRGDASRAPQRTALGALPVTVIPVWRATALLLRMRTRMGQEFLVQDTGVPAMNTCQAARTRVQVFVCRARAPTAKAARAATAVLASFATARMGRMGLPLPSVARMNFYPAAIRRTLGCVYYARLYMDQGVNHAPQAQIARA